MSRRIRIVLVGLVAGFAAAFGASGWGPFSTSGWGPF
jgi:hypothetical protein